MGGGHPAKVLLHGRCVCERNKEQWEPQPATVVLHGRCVCDRNKEEHPDRRHRAVSTGSVLCWQSTRLQAQAQAQAQAQQLCTVRQQTRPTWPLMTTQQSSRLLCFATSASATGFDMIAQSHYTVYSSLATLNLRLQSVTATQETFGNIFQYLKY